MLVDEYRRNLLEEADLGARWADGTARDKLIERVRRYAEDDFPAIDDAIVQCLESFENGLSEQIELKKLSSMLVRSFTTPNIDRSWLTTRACMPPSARTRMPRGELRVAQQRKRQCPQGVVPERIP